MEPSRENKKRLLCTCGCIRRRTNAVLQSKYLKNAENKAAASKRFLLTKPVWYTILYCYLKFRRPKFHIAAGRGVSVSLRRAKLYTGDMDAKRVIH